MAARLFVPKRAAVVECREEAVSDDILRGRSVADDQVGDGLHVAAVSGEQVGQHLGAPPTESLHRHPILQSIHRHGGPPADPALLGRYRADSFR